MKSIVIGVIAALLVHAAVLLFGGVFFFTDEEAKAKGPVKEVELFSEEASEAKDEAKPANEDLETKPAEELQEPPEKPPEMQQVYEAEEQTAAISPTDSIARLDAVSLSALESALSGGATAGGGDFFGGGVSLASGGRIGGTGAPGSTGGDGDGGSVSSDVFDVSELDQRARPVYQASPMYPGEMRQKKVEGVVNVVFIVDVQGRVLNPKVEKSTHEAFDRPALDAVRQWRFEPAVRGGEKVQSKVRIPIRFSLSS